MKFKISQLVIQLKKIIPGPLKSALLALGLGKLQSLLRNTSTAELEYQKSLVEVARNNQPELLEYWRKYRYLDDINAICKIESDRRVLDVGCGISTVLHFVKGERYGIDPLAVEYTRLYPFPAGIDIRQGCGEKIPFPDGYFDIVFSSSALDHAIDPLKTVAETRRVLKPDGYFVLCVDVFAENEVSGHSRYSLEKKDVYSLVANKFRTVLERESPRIPFKAYINGSRESYNQELIMILKKA
jgi:ubiquinone/menaquinone biosynthesis C-methylase UbiE